MNLNTLSPAPGSKTVRKRVGRGIGSGLGKTCGKGHKGQKARAGNDKINFEGGQTPIHRRLPKIGFTTVKSRLTAEIRMDQLNKIEAEVINLNTLKDYNLINKSIKYVKIIAAGEIEKPIKIAGLKITKGAKEALVKAGGSCEE